MTPRDVSRPCPVSLHRAGTPTVEVALAGLTESHCRYLLDTVASSGLGSFVRGRPVPLAEVRHPRSRTAMNIRALAAPCLGLAIRESTAMPSTPDGLTPTELHDYAEDERIHRNAEALAFTDLTALTAWFANISDAPRLTDWVLTELGVPEPDYHPSGHPIPGSITRKILHHAQVEGLVRQQQRRRSLVLVEG